MKLSLVILLSTLLLIPASAQTTFYFDGNRSISLNNSSIITLAVNTSVSLGSFQLNVTFDPSVIKAESIQILPPNAIAEYTINNISGFVMIGAISTQGIASGNIANLTLKGIKAGTSPLNIEIVDLTNTQSGQLVGSAENITIGVSASLPKGDFNLNGMVDIGDAAIVAYMVIGKVPPDLNADFNGNNRIDIGDAARIAYYLVGKVDKL